MGASTRSPESTAMSRTRCFFAETRLCAEPTTRPTSRALNTHTRAHTHTSLALLSPNLIPNLVPNRAPSQPQLFYLANSHFVLSSLAFYAFAAVQLSDLTHTHTHTQK